MLCRFSLDCIIAIRGYNLQEGQVVALFTPCAAADLKIDELVVATSIPDTQKNATLSVVHDFYQFWNTGDDSLLKHALAPNFTDRTLPPGRPQGPQGPAFASHQFRAAVPDLGVEVKKMIIAGDYVTVQWYSPAILVACLAKSGAAANP